MSRIVLTEQTVPATPSAGDDALYIDSADGQLKQLDSAGVVHALGGAVVHGPFQVTFADSAALNTPGVPVYTPVVGDVLLDIWVEIATAWDGTTPAIDVGQFLGGTTHGWFVKHAGALDASVTDTPIQTNDTYLSSGQPSSLAVAGTGAGAREVPGLFTGTDPILVVVSQDGTLGGGAVGGAAGVLNVYLTVATPVTP